MQHVASFLDGFVGINKAKTMYYKQKWFAQNADQSLNRQLGGEKGKSLLFHSLQHWLIIFYAGLDLGSIPQTLAE